MNQYIRLLKNEPIVRNLSISQFFSYFGMWFSHVAIYAILINVGASAFVISLQTVFTFLPAVLQAPLIGAVIDKINPKKLMLCLITIEIITTAFVLTIDDISQVPILFLLIFLRSSAASFYFSVEMSVIPKVIKDIKLLQFANSLQAIIWSFSYALGMALSGVFTEYLGIKVAILMDIGMFCLSLYIILSTKIDIGFRKVSTKYFTLLKEGIGYIKGDKKIIFLIILHSAVGVTVYDAIIVLAAKFYYVEVIAIPLAIGFINAIRTISLAIGSVIFVRFLNKKYLVYLFIIQGVSILIWGVMIKNFYLSLLGSFLAGFPTSILWAYTYSLIQLNTKKEYYGRVIAYNDMLFTFTAFLTSLSIGLMQKYEMDINITLIVLSIPHLMIAIYYLWGVKRYSIKF